MANLWPVADWQLRPQWCRLLPSSRDLNWEFTAGFSLLQRHLRRLKAPSHVGVMPTGYLLSARRQTCCSPANKECLQQQRSGHRQVKNDGSNRCARYQRLQHSTHRRNERVERDAHRLTYLGFLPVHCLVRHLICRLGKLCGSYRSGRPSPFRVCSIFSPALTKTGLPFCIGGRTLDVVDVGRNCIAVAMAATASAWRPRRS